MQSPFSTPSDAPTPPPATPEASSAPHAAATPEAPLHARRFEASAPVMPAETVAPAFESVAQPQVVVPSAPVAPVELVASAFEPVVFEPVAAAETVFQPSPAPVALPAFVPVDEASPQPPRSPFAPVAPVAAIASGPRLMGMRPKK